MSYLTTAHREGGWVLLQNIHLTIDWTCGPLEKMVRGRTRVHCVCGGGCGQPGAHERSCDSLTSLQPHHARPTFSSLIFPPIRPPAPSSSPGGQAGRGCPP